MSRYSLLFVIAVAFTAAGCGGSAPQSTELTPDLIEQAKVHDQKVQDEEKAHQAADKAAAR